MSTMAVSIRPIPPVPVSADFRHWLARAWSLYRAAPFTGWLLAMLPMIGELVLQLAVPVAGTLLSKVLVPLLGGWALVLVHRRATTGAYGVRAGSVAWTGRIPALLVLALASAVLVFGFQMLVLALIAGADQARAAALQDMDALDLSRWQVAGMLASGLLPSLLLLFAPAQVLLGGRSAPAAAADSLRAVVRWRVPLLPFAGMAVVLLLAVVWMPLVLLVLPVVFLYAGYAAWECVFGAAACDAG